MSKAWGRWMAAASLMAPGLAWASEASLGVPDAFAAVCYVGAPTLIALAGAKAGKAEQGGEQRRRQVWEMLACAVAGLALLALPSAVLEQTAGRGFEQSSPVQR